MRYSDRDRDRRRSFGDREGGGFERRGFAPVKVGDELDVTIESVGAKGDGVAKKDGFVLFVPNAKQGENVRIKVTRVLRKVGFAEIVGSAGASQTQEYSRDETPSEEPSEEGSEATDSDEESQDEEKYDTSQDSEDFGEDEEKTD